MSTSSLLQSAPHDGADNTCQQPTAAGVDQSRLNFLLRHLVRCPGVFEAGLDMLKPEHFTVPEEEVYQAAWAAAMDCYHRNDWPPVETALLWGMVERLAKGGDRLRLGQDSRIAQLISTILNDGDDEPSFNVKLALEVLHAFVEERERVEHPSPDQDGRHVEDQRIDRSAGEDNQQGEMQVEPAAHSAEEPTLPVSGAPAPHTPIPTGVPMLDGMMNGGSKPGDVNVILGPPNVGKTALGVQIVVSAGRLASTPTNTDAGRLHVHLSRARDRESIHILGTANAARVRAASLSWPIEVARLSTTDSLLDYDHVVAQGFDDSSGRVLGERERIEAVKPWMEQFVRLYEFDGWAAEPYIGEEEDGWVQGIRHTLNHLRSESGRQIGHVVIDSAMQALMLDPAYGSDKIRGELEKVEYKTLPRFNLNIPTSLSHVESKLLNPRDTWADEASFDEQQGLLIRQFQENFKRYDVAEEVSEAGPA